VDLNLDPPAQAFHEQEGDEESTEEPTEPPERRLDVKTLTDEFAKAGLVCGVMKPDQDSPSAETVVAVARRADIILLDWRLDDRGERASEIVKRLAECDGMRLIAIYTSAGGLDRIAESLAACLNEGDRDGVPRYVHEPDSFRVTGDGLTIEVYAKEGSQGDEAESERLILPQDIPGQLIDDFVRTTHGIVPTAAIATIGALRVDTSKVLGLLGADLDPGYLGHRMLLSDPDESGEHLIDLISSELRAVIEDNKLVRKAVGQAVIDMYVDQTEPGELPLDVLKEVLTVGLTNQEAREKLGPLRAVQDAKLLKGNGSRTRYLTGGDAEQALEADRRFAVKLSIRTPSRAAPRLGLGTLVKNGEKQYLICLQPECDSVRLTGARYFPFLPLESAEFKGQDLLIKEPDDWIGLKIVRSPYELRMLRFSPDPDTRTAMVRPEGDGFVFITNDGEGIEFIAQLRVAHSRDLAHQLATKIGRVGLDQSEVQRLWQKHGAA
jgi:hypothetical protein